MPQLCVIQVAFSLQNYSHYTEKWGKLLRARNMVLLFFVPLDIF